MTNTTLTLNTPELALEALEAVIAKFNAATEEMTLATKTVLMLGGAPLIGLAFVIALPVICVALNAYHGFKLIAARRAGIARHVKNVALLRVASGCAGNLREASTSREPIKTSTRRCGPRANCSQSSYGARSGRAKASIGARAAS